MALYSSLNKSILDETTALKELNKSQPQFAAASLRHNGGYNKDGFNYSMQRILGYKTQLFPEETSVMPVLGSFGGGVGQYQYVIPPTGLQVQISSSSANDTALGTGCQVVGIGGINTSFVYQEEFIPLNGQTPVVSTNTYLRLFGFIQGQHNTPTTVQNSRNVGNIFITPSGDATTAGVPNNVDRIIGTMAADFGAGVVNMFAVCPGCEFFPDKLTICSTYRQENQFDVIELNLLSAQGNSGFRKAGVFYVNTGNPVSVIDLTGLPSLSLATVPTITDITFTVRREGQDPSDDLSLSIFFDGVLVTPIP